MLTVTAIVFREGRLCHLKSIYKGRGVCNAMTDDQSLGINSSYLEIRLRIVHVSQQPWVKMRLLLIIIYGLVT